MGIFYSKPPPPPPKKMKNITRQVLNILGPLTMAGTLQIAYHQWVKKQLKLLQQQQQELFEQDKIKEITDKQSKMDYDLYYKFPMYTLIHQKHTHNHIKTEITTLKTKIDQNKSDIKNANQKIKELKQKETLTREEEKAIYKLQNFIKDKEIEKLIKANLYNHLINIDKRQNNIIENQKKIYQLKQENLENLSEKVTNDLFKRYTFYFPNTEGKVKQPNTEGKVNPLNDESELP